MQRIARNRELFTLDCQNALIHGTCHRASPQSPQAGRVGILFLPGFPMPRSAHGDAAVYWADAFAQQGFPSFRIDLPGTGDSNGDDLPPDLLQYLTAGGYENTVTVAVEQLVARYQLPGIVILGHCAGAISAILAAANSKLCVGMILLDPPFYVQPSGKRKVRKMLFYWSSRTRLGLFLSNAYDQANKIWLHLRRNSLPGNANFRLLKRWKNVASNGLPILLLNAPSPKTTGAQPRTGKFDYVQYIMKTAGNKSQVDLKVVEGANHAFSNPHGRTAVRMEVERWMRSTFTFEEPYTAPASFAGTVSSNAIGQIADAPAFGMEAAQGN